MYTIRYDIRVIKDLEQIEVFSKKKIRDAIESKLATQPEVFGKPLRQSLVGLRVLRLGNYRVIFQLRKSEILILLIGDRNSIYKEAQKRFG